MKKLLMIIMLALVGMNLQAQLPKSLTGGRWDQRLNIRNDAVPIKIYEVEVKGEPVSRRVSEQEYRNLIKQYGAQNVKTIYGPAG